MEQPILIVDDERMVLDAFRRMMRARYDLTLANSGAEGLEVMEAAEAQGRPFAVVVSDMQMPAMNGAQFLGRARQVSPDAVQMILSGQADLTSTIAAVNDGNLFRFLTKPIPPDNMVQALEDALRQHRLVHVERELLERTLQGAVDVLTEVLSLTNPVAFSRARELTQLVEGTLERLGRPPDWQLRLAAMLSQIGCVALPPEVLDRGGTGRFRTPSERKMYAAHPQLARDLLSRIPRLENVAAWVGEQAVNSDDEIKPPPEGPAAVFTAATAFLLRCETAEAPRDAARELGAAGYPQELLEALLEAVVPIQPVETVHQVRAEEIAEDMVLAQDVLTTSGQVLVRKGERVTATLAARVANFSRSVGVVEPISVVIPTDIVR